MHILGFLAACYHGSAYFYISDFAQILQQITFMMHPSHLSGHGTCIRSMPTPWVCVPDRGFFFCKTNVLRTTPLNPKGQSQCQKSDQWIFFNFLLLLLFIFIFKKAILSAHLYVWWLPVFHSFIIHTVLLSRSLLQRFYHWRSPKDLFDFSERTRLSSS